MLTKNSLLILFILALIAGLVTAGLAGVVGYSTATASNSEQAGPTFTVSGYATQYIGEDGVMFTDGTNTFKLTIENGSPTQIPLDTPVTITVEVKQATDNGGFEVHLLDVEQTGEAVAPDALPTLPINTVAEIQDQPVNDQRVVLQGQITQPLGDEYFLFTDGTGMIVLEIWNIPARLVPLNEPITVFGEVEINRLRGEVYIDVKGIQPVD